MARLRFEKNRSATSRSPERKLTLDWVDHRTSALGSTMKGARAGCAGSEVVHPTDEDYLGQRFQMVAIPARSIGYGEVLGPA